MHPQADEARSAHEARNWARTLELLDGQETLSATELLMRADSLYWTGEFDRALESYERAHAEYIADGDTAGAGLIAALLAYFALRREAFTVARSWVGQAQKLLADSPETLGTAWLKLLGVGMALFQEGDIETALSRCDDAVTFAQEIGSPSSQSVAMSFKGLAMIQTGDWKQGLALMDESMIVSMTGADDLRMTSDVYCNIISACRNLGDYVRAGEWTEEAERWMRSNSVNGYTGACQVHRAELKLYHGSWAEAEAESRRACAELERFRIHDYLGSAHTCIGETRRRMGDLEAAEREFQEAYSRGHDGQPGRSLLMMEQGDVEGALTSIKSAALRRDRDSEDKGWRGPSRARLLPALVEIALAADDVELAASAADELQELAETFDSAVWRAQATACQGAVNLSRDELDEAIELLESARRQYQKLDLPYEMATAQMLLGRAKAESGDPTEARLDYAAARDVMTKLGATSQVRRANELLGNESTELAPSSRVTMTFMFTDIVKSTDLIGVIGDEQWRTLLAWHDRTLRAAIEETGGTVVRPTGDGFFASFQEPRQAIESAVEIQRRLRRHRKESGFALHVRIGLHRTEATREGSDYSGGGVHAAARVGALAAGEQVLVSQAVLDAAGPIPYPRSETRTEPLKGVSEPMEIVEIDWH